MPKKKYDAYGHMVQLGKVSSLMQASIAISKLIVKEKKVLKRLVKILYEFWILMILSIQK